jgi:hypothetical protein
VHQALAHRHAEEKRQRGSWGCILPARSASRWRLGDDRWMGALNDCTTCGKTAKDLRRRALEWECSHVECPNRRSVPVLDGFEPTGPTIGRRTEGKVIVDGGNGGCFRRRSTACSCR